MQFESNSAQTKQCLLAQKFDGTDQGGQITEISEFTGAKLTGFYCNHLQPHAQITSSQCTFRNQLHTEVGPCLNAGHQIV